jgi:hypothetical protein
MNSFSKSKVFTNKCAKRKVERVVPGSPKPWRRRLNALKIVRLRHLISAPSAISLGIVFGEADPPLRNLSYRLRPNE